MHFYKQRLSVQGAFAIYFKLRFGQQNTDYIKV
jgi:hypothetical protein